jgi:membrane protein YdbS with pleckstrin-like domain
MKVQQKNFIFYIAMSFLMLGIIGYNYWSYRCGYCTLASLMSFSAPAVMLLIGIAIAILFLIHVRSKNKRLQQKKHCGCGALLRGQWNYCPSCGHQRKA